MLFCSFLKKESNYFWYTTTITDDLNRIFNNNNHTKQFQKSPLFTPPLKCPTPR